MEIPATVYMGRIEQLEIQRDKSCKEVFRLTEILAKFTELLAMKEKRISDLELENQDLMTGKAPIVGVLEKRLRRLLDRTIQLSQMLTTRDERIADLLETTALLRKKLAEKIVEAEEIDWHRAKCGICGNSFDYVGEPPEDYICHDCFNSEIE